jgi:hypothetical protein
MARDRVVHLTSAGLWNFRYILRCYTNTACRPGDKIELRPGDVAWGYDVNAFFDNTDKIPPFMARMFKRYLAMTNLRDMKGVAVQGLYLSA